MAWLIGITCALIGVVLGFALDRLWGWQQKRKAGLTGKAHKIVIKLGLPTKEFAGNYYLSDSPTQNYKVTNHIFQHADGTIIATSFRENPAKYGERDLARNLPNGGAGFTRITKADICGEDDAIIAKESLDSILPGASIVVLPENLFITSIDGIFCKLTDQTYLAFATFPKTGEQQRNRGILFYGEIAKAFFEYYRDISDKIKAF